MCNLTNFSALRGPQQKNQEDSDVFLHVFPEADMETHHTWEETEHQQRTGQGRQLRRGCAVSQVAMKLSPGEKWCKHRLA
jgi:hypothetical protein